jgi:hypothetical protein
LRVSVTAAGVQTCIATGGWFVYSLALEPSGQYTGKLWSCHIKSRAIAWVVSWGSCTVHCRIDSSDNYIVTKILYGLGSLPHWQFRKKSVSAKTSAKGSLTLMPLINKTPVQQSAVTQMHAYLVVFGAELFF